MADRRKRAAGVYWLALVLAFAGGLSQATTGAARGDDGWVITRFETRLEVERDGTVDVTETIAARFDQPKHGIFREIPVRYDVHGQLYDMRLHLKGVSDGAGQSRTYQTTDHENLVEIKI